MGGLAVRRREKLKFVDRCSRGPHNRTYNATRHFTLWKGQDQLRNKACNLFPVLPPKVMLKFTRRVGMLRDAYLTPHAANYVIAQNGRTSSIIHKAFARDKQVTETSSRPTITKEKLSFLDVSSPVVA